MAKANEIMPSHKMRDIIYFVVKSISCDLQKTFRSFNALYQVLSYSKYLYILSENEVELIANIKVKLSFPRSC